MLPDPVTLPIPAGCPAAALLPEPSPASACADSSVALAATLARAIAAERREPPPAPAAVMALRLPPPPPPLPLRPPCGDRGAQGSRRDGDHAILSLAQAETLLLEQNLAISGARSGVDAAKAAETIAPTAPTRRSRSPPSSSMCATPSST